jgi:hypothetical protein
MQISSSHLQVLPLSGASRNPPEQRDLPAPARRNAAGGIPATQTLEGELLHGARSPARQAGAQGQGEPPLEGGHSGRDQGLALNARRAISAYEGYARQDETEGLQAALGIDLYA